MFKVLFSAALIISTHQAIAAQDMYCSSNDVSATLFLHASQNQYVFKNTDGSPKVYENYTAGSNTIDNTPKYSIQYLPESSQALVKLKASGLEFVLNCR